MTVFKTGGFPPPDIPQDEQWRAHLVLVEGATDQEVVAALIEYESLEDFQVHDMKGKDGWGSDITALRNTSGFRKTVRSIGLVRDADGNGHNQFQSGVAALRTAGLPTPMAAGQLVAGPPAVAIEIVPSIDKTGAIEALCLESFDQDRRDCVNGYFKCLQDKEPEYTDKAEVQVYVAGLEPHCKSLAVAALSGRLDLAHEVFNRLRTFVHGLSGN